MKICSFLPTATAMLYTLGLEDAVAGVTHECEFPPAARQKPVVLRSIFDPGQHSSAEIDRLVRESLGRGESIYRPDLERLAAIEPDLLITQDICEVCAIPYHEVLAVKEALGGRPQILPLNPHSVAEMLADIRRVAAAAGVAARGDKVVAGLGARVAAVSARAAGAPAPRVLCLEWFEPLFSAGHWVPELVELAGGVEGLGVKHAASTVLSWANVVAYQPEVLVLMPCGFDVARTEREMPLLTRLPGWSELPAVRSGRVWGVWGHKYFSGAGPYLVDGLELLARIIHPELCADGEPAPVDAKRLG
jgi:iron complex transport system substrate-binding protein